MSREEREFVGQSLGEAAREATRASGAFDDAVVALMGINVTDGRACDVLEQYGRLTAGELAEHLGLTTGAVTTVIDRLERVGMVERLRDPSDRRRVYVSASPAAHAMFASIYTPYKRAWAVVTRDFSEEEMRAARTFERLSKDLNTAFAALVLEATPPKGATNEERMRAVEDRLASFDASALRLRRGDDE